MRKVFDNVMQLFCMSKMKNTVLMSFQNEDGCSAAGEIVAMWHSTEHCFLILLYPLRLWPQIITPSGSGDSKLKIQDQ